MLFLVAHVGIFSYMKRMNAVMTALIAAAIVDPASRNDRHVRAICDVKIIIYKIRHAGNADTD